MSQRPVSQAARGILRAQVPELSVPGRLVTVASVHGLAWSTGPEDAPATTLLAAKGATGAVVAIPAEHAAHLDTPEHEARLLLDVAARWLGDPGSRGREALAEQLWEEGPPHLTAPPSGDALVEAIDTLDPASDPLWLVQAQLLAALPDDLPLRSAAHLRAAWRRHLGLQGRADRGPVPPAHQRRAWLASGELTHTDDGLWLPTAPTPQPTHDDAVRAVLATLRPGQVVGVAGSAGAGKSTLAVALGAALAAAGHRVQHVHGDDHTWAGPTFRYVQDATTRRDLLDGPGLYDDRGLHRAVLASAHTGATVVVDGVFVGLDPAMRATCDLLVLVHADDAQRLADKRRRDTAPDSVRRIDVTTDFATKVFREGWDCVRRLARSADVIVHRS